MRYFDATLDRQSTIAPHSIHWTVEHVEERTNLQHTDSVNSILAEKKIVWEYMYLGTWIVVFGGRERVAGHKGRLEDDRNIVGRVTQRNGCVDSLTEHIDGVTGCECSFRIEYIQNAPEYPLKKKQLALQRNHQHAPAARLTYTHTQNRALNKWNNFTNTKY